MSTADGMLADLVEGMCATTLSERQGQVGYCSSQRFTHAQPDLARNSLCEVERQDRSLRSSWRA